MGAEMPKPRRVLVASLGGTITMTAAASGGVVPALTAQDLLAAVPGLADLEVAVETVEKGEGIAKGSLAYVRYWHKEGWLGRRDTAPIGTAGHRGLPKEGDRVRAYLARNAYDGFGTDNRDGGLDVIGANGFQPPPAPAAGAASAPEAPPVPGPVK